MATLPARRTSQLDLGLTVLRVQIGVIFVAHGLQKFFVFGLPGTTGAPTQMGVPLPAPSAPPVAADMLVALLLVHLRSGLFAPNGIGFVLALLAASVALALTGPGKYAPGALLGRRPA